jgi:hypothetical protein
VSLLIALGLALSPIRLQARCAGPERATIPHGHAILIDGHLETTEWDDACEIPVTSNYRLLVKHDTAYFYIAVVRSTAAVFGVNLYLASPQSSSSYLNLHASAKLGERVGRRSSWSDWVWWNNRRWSANVERFNAFTGQRFLPDTTKEFQIALDRLPGTRFLLTFDIETPDGTEQPAAKGPIQDGVHWIPLQLAP